MRMEQKSLAELTEEALGILQRQLGAANTIRFLRQFSPGFGDYTAERATHEDETLDELLDQIRARRVRNGSPLGDSVDSQQANRKRIDEIRRRYPRAYERWTAEEDAQLRQEHQAGLQVQELSQLLKRQPSAIESRLQKLGLTR